MFKKCGIKYLAFWILLLFADNSISQTGPAGVLSAAQNRFWFAASFESYTEGSPVSQWNNQGGNTLDAAPPIATNSPTFRDNVIDNMNGYPCLHFDGVDDMLWIQDNTDLNTSQQSQRSMFFTIRTGIDVLTRQYIYQEGGGTRGIGLYIFGGQLYLGAWNLNNDGAGSPWGFSSTNLGISANTEYIIGFIFNGNNSTSGTIDLHLNGSVVGTINNVGLLYTHGNDISIGACKNNTVHELGNFSGDGHHFNGYISEVIYYNQVLNTSRISLINNYLSAKYNIGLSSGDNYLMDNASNGNFDHEMFGVYRVAGGNQNSDAQGSGILRLNGASSLGNGDLMMIGHDKGSLTEVVLPVPASSDLRMNRVWRVSESGDVGSVNLNFDISSISSAGLGVSDYFLLIDGVDTDFSNSTSIGASSLTGSNLEFNAINLADGDHITIGVKIAEVGNTGPGGVFDNTHVKFWFDASDQINITPDNALLQTWINKGGNTLNAFQNSNGRRPRYQFDAGNNINGFPVLQFDGNNDYYTISNNTDINLGTHKERSFFMAFRTGSNVTNRQVLFEEGGTVRGLNIYISGGLLYFGGWNLNSDGSGSPWGFSSASTAINTNTQYCISAVYKGTSSTNGTLSLYLNGSLVAQTNSIGYLYGHSGAIGIGGKFGDTYYENGPSNNNGHYFNGDIAEFIIIDKAVGETRRRIIENSLTAKYGINMSVNNHYVQDNVSNGNFDYDVAGIGSLGTTNHIDAKGPGPVRMFLADNLDNGEFLIWGHDSALICNSTNVPLTIENRLSRLWKVSEIGDVGNTSIEFDITNFGITDPSQVTLLVDTDQNFTNASIVGLSSSSGSTARFDNVNLNDAQFFTIASSETFYDNDNSTTWSGANSSNWSTTANWSHGIPTAKISAIIPTGLSNYPTISANAVCKNLTIESGAILTMNNTETLTIDGAFVNDGIFNPANSTVILSEGCSKSVVRLGGTSQFYNLEINNSSGVEIENSELQMLNILRLSNGTLTTNDSLKLVSNASGTARIAEITGGSITGSILNERYIDAGETNWRFLTFPVSGADLEQFDDDFITSGIPGSDYPNWPNPSNPWPSFYFYNENSGTSFDDGFIVPSSMSEIVGIGSGVWIWCGDTITGTQPFTIDVRGPANTGTINLPVSFNVASGNMDDDGWNMVANPYPCTIDWDSPNWTKTNIEDAIYIWNPDLQQYATYIAGASTNGGGRLIASSQAFMVHADANNPVLTIQESCKVDQGQGFLKSNTISTDLLRIEVHDAVTQDEMVVRFDPNVTHGFDKYADARKNENGLSDAPRIFSVLNSDKYAINSLNSDSSRLVLPVSFTAHANGVHTIKITDIAAIANMHCVFLEDLQTGNFVNLLTDTIYQFNADVLDPSERFLIHFSIEPKIELLASSCDSTGLATLIIDGFNDPSYYSFFHNGQANSGIIGPNGVTIDSVVQGTFNVNVSHLNGICPSISQSVSFTPVSTLQSNESVNFVSCPTCCDASISILPNGGTPPYTIIWDDASLNGFNPSSLCPGNYDYTIYDDNNCEFSGSIEQQLFTNLDNKEFEVFIYPNPANQILNISSSESFAYTITDALGRLVMTGSNHAGTSTLDVSDFANGIYHIRLLLNDRHSHYQFIKN